MRETATFRSTLEQLNRAFPEQELLRISDVAMFAGCSVNTAKKRFPFIRRTQNNSGGCTKVQLARELSR